VLIPGTNNNAPVSTNNVTAIKLALQGNAFGPLNARQNFISEFTAAQLNLLFAGGGGSPPFYNNLWANLSCYSVTFAPVTLSNGVTLTTNSMVKDLFMQAHLATIQNRGADFQTLGLLFELLNGTSTLGFCN
jgi:hypothetical protein